ncbi:hypothetical protein BD410DRAFT_828909 [Rickenella mellea]|uniref:HMG box domain-containing protein n=1 Tax=Rickenella mellea TaxID=50990 RepID=A0A4Y7Q4C1_9AGAM|nr:hypothetical protein BD410DRAFT_828909 [Rickenella mellea]
MPRTATATTTKTATKRANAKTTKAKEDKPEKVKRAPSAYNIFMGIHLKKWREEHPGGSVKEGMTEVAAMWRDSPENPKRGQPPAVRKPKAGKENKKAKNSDAEEEEPD